MEADIMLRLYFKNICSRPSCYACHFKTLHRLSDITIFDCWNARSVSKAFSDKGATNVFIHTDKGRCVFESIKSDFVWSSSEIDPIIGRDGVMIKHSVPMNPMRKFFFDDLEHKPLSYIEKKYLNCSLVKKMLAALKPFLHKIGVFKIYLLLKK